MFFCELLKTIFFWIFSFIVFCYLITSTKETFGDSTDRKKPGTMTGENLKTSFREKVERAYILASLLVLIILTVFTVFIWKQYYFVVVIIALTQALQISEAFCLSLPVLGNLVKSKDKGKLSTKEKNATMIVSFFVFFLNYYVPIGIFTDTIENCKQPIMHDLLITLFLIAYYLVFLFLIVLLSAEALEFISAFFTWLAKKIKSKDRLKHFCDDYIKKAEEPSIKHNSISILIWDKIIKWIFPFRLLRYPVFCVTFIFDVLIWTAKFLLVIVMIAFGTMLRICRSLKKAMVVLGRKMLNLSDRHIMSIAIRISPIMALFFAVVASRFQPFYMEEDRSVAILEFVASAIIIPIVFEWIYSAKRDNTCSPEE